VYSFSTLVAPQLSAPHPLSPPLRDREMYS